MSTRTNKCKYCSLTIKNGIIRDSNIFCNEECNKLYYAAYRPMLIPKPVRIIKCNYCLIDFDASIRTGINYNILWFCCEEHLNLANPRPKVSYYPIAPHIMPPMVLHRNPYMGHIFVPGMSGYYP